MSSETKIEWATHTWNPWEGCTKVSPGCANCYAEARNKRFHGGANWGKGKPRRRTSAASWKLPMRWDLCSGHWERARVFPSLCDWLDDEVPIEWLADFLKLIHHTPNLDWLLLTKRPENWRHRIARASADMLRRTLNRDLAEDWLNGALPPNVWPGTSIEDQQRADERIPELLKIPAKVRFLSVEPLLGPVEFSDVTRRSDAVSMLGRKALTGIDWVIVGGESGPRSRPCGVGWVRSIVQQCRAANVPVFVKQLGSNPLAAFARLPLSHPKGGDPSEWPEDLRVRELPQIHAGHAT